jgi:hypothetical protein
MKGSPLLGLKPSMRKRAEEKAGANEKLKAGLCFFWLVQPSSVVQRCRFEERQAFVKTSALQVVWFLSSLELVR